MSERIIAGDKFAAMSALKSGSSLVTEVTGCVATHRAFVGVYPLDLSKERSRRFVRNHGVEITPKTGMAYHVRRFSVDRELILKDIWLGETDLENKVSKIAFSEAELAGVLDEFGVTLGSLEIPAMSDYPI